MREEGSGKREEGIGDRDAFLEASFWYGKLDQARKILEAHPGLASSDIYVAAALGDDRAVRRFIATDPSLVRKPGGPRNVDALTYLCFSRYLRVSATETPNPSSWP